MISNLRMVGTKRGARKNKWIQTMRKLQGSIKSGQIACPNLHTDPGAFCIPKRGSPAHARAKAMHAEAHKFRHVTVRRKR